MSPNAYWVKSHLRDEPKICRYAEWSYCLHVFQSLELLDPGSQLDLPRPCVARLTRNVKVGIGDGVRVEQRVCAFGRHRSTRGPNPPVDHEVRDVDVLRRELARHALRETA